VANVYSGYPGNVQSNKKEDVSSVVNANIKNKNSNSQTDNQKHAMQQHKVHINRSENRLIIVADNDVNQAHFSKPPRKSHSSEVIDENQNLDGAVKTSNPSRSVSSTALKPNLKRVSGKMVIRIPQASNANTAIPH
jgi:hypothetical protein